MKGWNFLDIGANLGSWTLPAAMNVKGHGGKVISVEADPQTIGTLTESVGLNSLLGSVDLVQKAVVRDSNAKTSICLSQGDVSKVENIGGNQAALGSRNSTFTACDKEVKTMTLDDLYAANPDMKNVAAMKLDCEGCEGQAILGGHKFLTETPPCFIAMEITEGYLCDSDTPLEEIKTFLHDHGYDTSKIVGPHGGPTCKDYLSYEKQNNLPPGSVQDFVMLGRRDASDATACMARFQDTSFKL
jgi:FkbM family methyltransferase